jgi:hypothetical protein
MENNSAAIDFDVIKIIAGWSAFLKKWKVLILIFIFLGMLYSIFNFFKNPLKFKSYYRTDYVLQSSVVQQDVLNEILSDFELKLNDGSADITQLASEMGISPEVLRTFKSIKVHKDPAGLVPSIPFGLKVDIEVLDKSKIEMLLQGIERYITSNAYFKSRYALMKDQNVQLLSAINKQLSEIDSLKRSGQAVLTQNPVKFMINRESEYVSYVELMEKKLEVEKKLLLLTPIEFIVKNTSLNYVNNTLYNILNILGYSFVGMFLGIFIAFIFNLFSKIKSV